MVSAIAHYHIGCGWRDEDEEKMVPLSGESANQIFQDLEDWNRILAATSIKPPQP